MYYYFAITREVLCNPWPQKLKSFHRLLVHICVFALLFNAAFNAGLSWVSHQPLYVSEFQNARL